MDYSQRTNAEVCDDYGNVGSSIQQEWYHGAQAGFEKTNGFWATKNKIFWWPKKYERAGPRPYNILGQVKRLADFRSQ